METYTTTMIDGTTVERPLLLPRFSWNELEEHLADECEPPADADAMRPHVFGES